MAMRRVPLPAGEFVNLYTESGIAPGTKITLQNKGGGGLAQLHMYEGAATPSLATPDVIVPYGTKNSNRQGALGAWAMMPKGGTATVWEALDYVRYRKFGRIGAIQASEPAHVWDFGEIVGAELYVFPTTASIDTVSSSNAGDTQAIEITGLDIDYNEVIQDVTLDGQNKVTLDTPLFRHNRVYNGSAVATLGDVYVYEDTAIVLGVPTDKGAVKGYMSSVAQQSLQSIYTVPAGLTAELVQLKTAIGGRKSGFATYEAFVRLEGGVFRILDTHELAADGTSLADDVFAEGSIFPEKTDFLPLVTVSANDIGFSLSFRINLYPL